VQADYLADDAEQETVDRFFEVHDPPCCLGSCCSTVCRVTRWRGTWSPMLVGSTTRPWTPCPDQLGQLYSCERVQGVVLGGVEGSCGGADPSRMSSSSSALVPWAFCDWSASCAPLRVQAPARGPRPARPFHHGLFVVPSECNFLPFTFNLSFHFV
jgi:hypothetical protein